MNTILLNIIVHSTRTVARSKVIQPYDENKNNEHTHILFVTCQNFVKLHHSTYRCRLMFFKELLVECTRQKL